MKVFRLNTFPWKSTSISLYCNDSGFVVFQKSQYYAKIAAQLQLGIDNVLWNEEEGIWFDYDAKNNRPRSTFYPSNLAPLYTRSYNRQQNEQYALSAVKYLKSQGIDYFFGEYLIIET